MCKKYAQKKKISSLATFNNRHRLRNTVVWRGKTCKYVATENSEIRLHQQMEGRLKKENTRILRYWYPSWMPRIKLQQLEH